MAPLSFIEGGLDGLGATSRPVPQSFPNRLVFCAPRFIMLSFSLRTLLEQHSSSSLQARGELPCVTSSTTFYADPDYTLATDVFASGNTNPPCHCQHQHEAHFKSCENKVRGLGQNNPTLGPTLQNMSG